MKTFKRSLITITALLSVGQSALVKADYNYGAFAADAARIGAFATTGWALQRGTEEVVNQATEDSDLAKEFKKFPGKLALANLYLAESQIGVSGYNALALKTGHDFIDSARTLWLGKKDKTTGKRAHNHNEQVPYLVNSSLMGALIAATYATTSIGQAFANKFIGKKLGKGFIPLADLLETSARHAFIKYAFKGYADKKRQGGAAFNQANCEALSTILNITTQFATA